MTLKQAASLDFLTHPDTVSDAEFGHYVNSLWTEIVDLRQAVDDFIGIKRSNGHGEGIQFISYRDGMQSGTVFDIVPDSKAKTITLTVREGASKHELLQLTGRANEVQSAFARAMKAVKSIGVPKPEPLVSQTYSYASERQNLEEAIVSNLRKYGSTAVVRHFYPRHQFPEADLNGAAHDIR